MGLSVGNILIVDDEPNALKVLSAILEEDGYMVTRSDNVDDALEFLISNDFDAVITDLKMPGKDGMFLFDYIQENIPDIPVIFLTAFGTVESAVQAMNRGAYYYFVKPPNYTQLKGILSRAVEQRKLKKELELMRKRLLEQDNHIHIIGTTQEMKRIFEVIDAVKESSSTVLITGETGTGKELIARSLHFNSSRREKPFVPVNCAAIPKDLIESELFGYEKGAFTGATSRRIGKFEEASGGTLFLDEIGELELPLQSKLLRVLQERELERLGSNKTIKVDFRLICSTNRNLKEEVKSGNFREDLYYRINVVEINVPPLRKRVEDIPLLAMEFLNEFSIREKKKLSFSDEVIDIFRAYHWPGNIRQLKNIIERAVVLARTDRITLRELPDELRPPRKKFIPRKTSTDKQELKTLKELEEQAIITALKECNGNKSKAAKMLGISRKAFYKRLKEYNINL